MKPAAQPLCAAGRCRGWDRHRPDCPGDDCRGCLPALAAPGLALCERHTAHIAQDAVQAAQLHAELAQRLMGGSGQGEPVAGTSDHTRLPNEAAVEARTLIRHTLTAWTRLIADERGWTLPADTVDAMAGYVARSAPWLAAHPAAADCSDELHELAHGRPRSIAYPTGVRVADIAPCPQDGCDGTVHAIIRPADALLPSELACDADTEHRWPAGMWHAFRRAVERRIPA